MRRARPLEAARAVSGGGWLILAPHPDDETLGAGGLISALVGARAQVRVAFLTDGSGSHVDAPGWSPRRVASVRAREAAAALRLLGLTSTPHWLGWRDAAPFPLASAERERTLRTLVALCRRHRIRQIVSSWEGDPHCDHQAAARLATELACRIGGRALFYAVWGWTRPDLDERTAPWRTVALPVARWRGQQRRALDRHGTQLGGRIAGAAERFVLPRAMRRLVDVPYTVLLEPRNAP